MFQSLFWWILLLNRFSRKFGEQVASVSILVLVDFALKRYIPSLEGIDYVQFQSLFWWILLLNPLSSLFSSFFLQFPSIYSTLFCCFLHNFLPLFCQFFSLFTSIFILQSIMKQKLKKTHKFFLYKISRLVFSHLSKN